MIFSKPKAVLFDWDNTLVDTWPVIHQALHETFLAMGHVPWTLEEVKTNVKHSARDAFPPLFGDQWERAADIYRDAYRSRNLENLAPLPHATEVLEKLKSQNIAIGIVSNKVGETLRKEVEHLGWNHYFGSLIGATDTAHDKPHPAPVYKALEDLQLAASEDIWFIGDSEVDVEVANRAGLIALLYGPATLDACNTKFRGQAFRKHFHNHAEFLTLLG